MQSILTREQFVKKIPQLILLFDKNPSMRIAINYDFATDTIDNVSKNKKTHKLEKEYKQALQDYNSQKTRTLAVF